MKLSRATTASAIAVATVSLAFSQTVAQQILGDYEGVWQGSLAVVSTSYENQDELPTIGDEFLVHLEIDANEATVSLPQSTQWKPRIQTTFRVSQNRNGAVIFAVVAYRGLVESWIFNATLKDAESLLVFLSRIVGSSEQASGSETQIAIGAIGELSKISEK